MPADVRNSAEGKALAKRIRAAQSAGCSNVAVIPVSTCGHDLRRAPVEVLRTAGNRNLPCPCGSGKKFKKCCFYNSAPVTILP